jgi:hypothetical protein
MSSELRAAAWGYLSRGLSVIALTGKMPNGKIHPHGLYDAISGVPEGPDDDRVLREVFDHPDTTGIGILTNTPYVVVDIDGEEGAEAWKQIAGEDFMPDRWVAKTGRGLHLWYADWGRHGTTKLGAKLDMKGHGGYVAAPPSLHPDGHTYTWLLEPGDLPPMEIPAGLSKILSDKDWELQRRTVGRELSKWIEHEQFSEGRIWATHGDFTGLIRTVAEAEEGNRNAALHWAACVMAENRADDEEYDKLVEAAEEAGLTARETRLTIRSARKAAANG